MAATFMNLAETIIFETRDDASSCVQKPESNDNFASSYHQGPFSYFSD